MARSPKLTNRILSGLGTALGAWLSGDLEDFDDEVIKHVLAAETWLNAVRQERAERRRKRV